MWRHGDPTLGATENGKPLEFAKKAALSNTDDCIIWPFDKASSGHGGIYIDGKRHQAHAFVFKLSGNDPSDASLWCLHDPRICNNPSCVNPRHLRWGSCQENCDDKFLANTVIYGENCYNSKITENTAIEMRRLYRTGEETFASLSVRFGVSANAVRSCVRGKTWKNVAGPVKDYYGSSLHLKNRK